MSDRSVCPCAACIEYRTFMQAMTISESGLFVHLPAWVEYALASDGPIPECEVEVAQREHELFMYWLNEEADKGIGSPEEIAYKQAHNEEKWVIADIVE